MAYTAKTWATNEVITSTALNNLEIGAEEAYLLSEQVIDTDKSWNDKKITDLENVSGPQFLIAASDTEIFKDTYSAATKNSPNTGGYGLVVTSVIPGRYGKESVIRLSTTCTVHENPIGYAAANVDVRVNGSSVALHALPYAYPGTTTTNTDDITVSPGDIITVYISGSQYDEGRYYSTTYLTEFKVSGDDPFAAWSAT